MGTRIKACKQVLHSTLASEMDPDPEFLCMDTESVACEDNESEITGGTIGNKPRQQK